MEASSRRAAYCLSIRLLLEVESSKEKGYIRDGQPSTSRGPGCEFYDDDVMRAWIDDLDLKLTDQHVSDTLF